MKFRVVIPARFASSRLPGKPLVEIQGQTMIERVYRQALKSSAASVVVATDHQAVFDAVQEFGGDVLMTRNDHPSGTDRLAEVADKMGMSDADILVNVQGDEPLIPPEVIDQVATNLADNAHCDCATLCEPITDLAEFLNPNSVKLVLSEHSEALYFSRAPIPWPRDHMAGTQSMSVGQPLPQQVNAMRHIGLYAYKAGLLRQFTQWAPAPLEQIESLEQLRILHYGGRIHLAPSCAPVPGGVDTEDDLERVHALIAANR